MKTLLEELKLTSEAYDLDLASVVKGFILGVNYFYDLDEDSHYCNVRYIFEELIKLQKEGHLGNHIGDLSGILK